MNELKFIKKSYEHPEMEMLLCDNTSPLLDSPTAGFGGDEGGLEIDDLD